MRVGLIDVMKKVEKSGYKPDTSILSRPVPVEIQRKISDAAMDFIGYDTKSPNAGGRLDETEHPFTTGYYDDVRITTHYHEDRWVSSLYSVMHEGGHAMYDQNLPQAWMYQPIGSAASYGIHESQSRFVENMVGQEPRVPQLHAPPAQEDRRVSHSEASSSPTSSPPSTSSSRARSGSRQTRSPTGSTS